MATIKEYKLDIFNCLSQIDKKNIHFYDNLSIDQKKGFIQLIIMRWLYGTPYDLQVILLNQFVNPYIFSLSKHPGLIYKLMTVTAVKPTRHTWKPKPTNLNFPLSLTVIANYFEISKRTAKLHLPLLCSDDILNMGLDLGMQSEEIKKLKLELKNI